MGAPSSDLQTGRSDKPLILVTNDDGLEAAGLAVLARAASAFGEVWTVAPERNQSAKAHSVTLHRPLRLREVSSKRFALDGTPADCVYVALYHPELLSRRPDVVLSGINHGANLGSDVYYSGTVAAAREGALRGIPSAAFSWVGPGEIAAAESVVSEIIARLVLPAAQAAPEASLLNVNIPGPLPGKPYVASLGDRHYGDGVALRHDPRGSAYLWMGGPPLDAQQNAAALGQDDADTSRVARGEVAVTALRLKLEDHARQQALATLLEG